MEKQHWQLLSEVYGFIGNSFLLPMSRTAPVGLDPTFWAVAPAFGNDACTEARAALSDRVGRIREDSSSLEKAVERVSIEFTKLFIGPPSPSAPPWETLYAPGNSSVGFGEATVDMRRRLTDAGMAVVNENRQYEDHIGIELLYLCELCRRLSHEDSPESESTVADYIVQRPLSWIAAFRQRVEEHAPVGYYAPLARYAESVLSAHLALIAASEQKANRIHAH